jgi:hypothetical protein
MTALCEYDWPGNIRELQNIIERAVILSPGPVLRVPLHDLRHRTIAVQHTGHDQTLEQVERAHILRTLNETNWILSGPHGAATRLAINRSTLQYRMRKLGIVRVPVLKKGLALHGSHAREAVSGPRQLAESRRESLRSSDAEDCTLVSRPLADSDQSA